jgi:hypothetical protein
LGSPNGHGSERRARLAPISRCHSSHRTAASAAWAKRATESFGAGRISAVHEPQRLARAVELPALAQKGALRPLEREHAARQVARRQRVSRER